MKRLAMLFCLGQAIGAMCALGAEFVSVTVVSRGGSGGSGGNGGGGAGAGLGGRGGSGGAGAPETQTEPVSGGVAAADDGDSGMSGENGGACGEVLVYGSKTFRGGAVTATNQTDGATGDVAHVKTNSLFYAAFGGSGGGAGGDGGAAYVLCAAADLRAFADGEAVTEYGPEICGADGSVTFKGVCRPAEGRGFFTIRCER